MNDNLALVPLGVRLAGVRCVCVGGGSVAARRVPVLLAGGARVTVVAPSLDPSLRDLVTLGRCEHVGRPFEPGDCIGAFLVMAATGNPIVDTEVAREAAGGSVLTCVASDPDLGNCVFMATARRGRLVVALHSGGAAPAVTAALRRRIETALPERLGEILDRLATLRAELRLAEPDPLERARRWREAVDSGVLDTALGEGTEAAYDAVARILTGDELAGSDSHAE
ncbi:MAG TPA: bifunctional precorrin-2 dehydrogenase/sirohydrochlorin ferrochelatase [Chloroflexota bacterium]|nr:bifunctional precorrin-2 dehydrogenase/sirohydrochlorin ferrochelatase [Chloroflexota bacterium]